MPEATSGPRGAFILVEGVDRAGKSTQCKLLAARLRQGGRKVREMRFPDRSTATGKRINDYLASKTEMEDREIHKLFSENRREASDQIRRDLDSSVTIICDRYAYSGVAYSAAKMVPGMSIEWCKEVDRGLPAPDVVIFLDLPAAAARERGDYGLERYEKEEFQRKVRQNFLDLLEADTATQAVTWHKVDASGSLDEVAELVWEGAIKAVEDAAKRPIALLWLEPAASVAADKSEDGSTRPPSPVNGESDERPTGSPREGPSH